MANQGFVRDLNLSEVRDGAKLLQNLAGSTVNDDLLLFAGLSQRKSELFWDSLTNSASIEQSGASLQNAIQFQWDTNYTYTDDDYVDVVPINLLQDISTTYVGFAPAAPVLINSAGPEILYDRGENYTEGNYPSVALTGGNGSGARANIIVDFAGQVSSVEIIDDGLDAYQTTGVGYERGDILEAPSLPGGSGFAIRVNANPWKVALIGNYAWSTNQIVTNKLRVQINNTSNNLNGTYDVDQVGGNNTFVAPQSSTLRAYDVNRKLYSQKKISDNIDLYNVSGNGTLSQWDADVLNIFYNNPNGLTPDPKNDVNYWITYVNSTPPPAGSSRNTGQRVYFYLTGLDDSVFDIDGTGTKNELDYDLLTEYIQSNGNLYTRLTANAVLGASETNAGSLEHSISISVRVEKNPNYTVPENLDRVSKKPYFIIYKNVPQTDNYDNIFDNFSSYGTLQTCTTTVSGYLQTSIGQVKVANGITYRIASKNAIGNSYFVNIVSSGSGFEIGSTIGNNPPLTIINSKSVFDTTSEYGVFDSNGSNKFFLRTNARSSNDSLKTVVLFSENFTLPSYLTNEYSNVPTTTLLPDIVFVRDDALTLSNIQNLEPPQIQDRGNDIYSSNLGGFSYNIRDYSDELSTISSNVDESIYLRSTKYRIDRALYYQREISINGLITSYDPDGLNQTETDILLDNSPGIYISNSLSQITNTLAADFAQKTRSFSSDYNPWSADTDNEQLLTESLNVTINDLVWTNEISLDIGTYQGVSRYKNGNTALGETLDANFNSSLLTQGKSFKLKIEINGEEYYLIMRKP